MSNVMNSDAQAPQGVIVAYIPGASLLDLASIKAELDQAVADFPGTRIEVRHSDITASVSANAGTDA